MTDTVVESLILDLLEWITSSERSYEDVMNAWHTSCPRLPVWEDANDRGLIVIRKTAGRSGVGITEKGRALLAETRS
jgi:predicted transcriptional regulator